VGPGCVGAFLFPCNSSCGPRFRYILGYRILPIPDVEITLEGWVRLVSFLIECLCGEIKASVPLDCVFICQE